MLLRLEPNLRFLIGAPESSQFYYNCCFLSVVEGPLMKRHSGEHHEDRCKESVQSDRECSSAIGSTWGIYSEVCIFQEWVMLSVSSTQCDLVLIHFTGTGLYNHRNNLCRNVWCRVLTDVLHKKRGRKNMAFLTAHVFQRRIMELTAKRKDCVMRL